jgi:hypothetical protein
MALKSNTFEGGTNGTTVTTGNSGGTSGTAFDAVTISSGTVQYTTSQAMHGLKSCAFNNVTAAAHLDYTGYATSSMVARFYVRFDALPGAAVRLLDIRTSTVSVARVSTDSSNRLVFQTNNGATTLLTTAAISATTWYRVEVATTNGTSGATLKFDYYAGDSGTPVASGYSNSAQNTGTTANITQAFFGSVASTAYTGQFEIDDFAVLDGTLTYLGAASAPPTAVLTTTQSGLAVTANGSTSTVVSPATISSYDYDWGDGTTHGSGATPAAHAYSAAGTYTITLTVTDSNSLTSTATATVTVAAAAGTVTAQTVDVSTNWTASTSTALVCVTDGDPTTFVTSQAPPTGQEFDFTLQALTPPAIGQPFKVFLTMDALLAASASLAAQLYEGATLRSSLTSVTIPAGSGSTVAGLVTLTFPWTDVQNVTTGGWSAVKVKLQVTAS